MFHVCVRRFDVMGTVEIFLGTKQNLSVCVLYTAILIGRKPLAGWTERDASGLAREPTYKLNFRGLLRQPT